VVWARWRQRLRGEDGELAQRPAAFEDLLEEAPVAALLMDRDRRVLAANEAARQFFRVESDQLPLGLLDATREGRLLEALRAGTPESEVRLTHSQRTVQIKLVPGPMPGDTLMFVRDVSELRRLETVRQEFVANLSHELKTPLTSLRLAVESIGGEPSPPVAARRRFAARALKETDHLASIVANLRELAQIEAGHTSLALSCFDVCDLVAEAADRLRLERRRLDMCIEEGLKITADRTRLAQALGNLLDNAAKYSPPDSPVEVAAGMQGGEFRLTVRDHGPGISPEHWPRVFERFYKVDPARSRVGDGARGVTRATTGSGLGLAITKHLVRAQGGRVWTEAARDGGQVFGMAIPVPIVVNDNLTSH
jgi:two-component system phosphate regulon sensor histidine kinase PhoR